MRTAAHIDERLAHPYEDEAPMETDDPKPSHGFPQVPTIPANKSAKAMMHELEVNFNKITPFGTTVSVKGLQNRAIKSLVTLIYVVVNADVAELRHAATFEELNTIALTETLTANIASSNAANIKRTGAPLDSLITSSDLELTAASAVSEMEAKGFNRFESELLDVSTHCSGQSRCKEVAKNLLLSWKKIDTRNMQSVVEAFTPG